MEKSTEIQKSLTILLSLFVMIEQNYEALVYYESFLSCDTNTYKSSNLPDKRELYIDEAIIESVWFQIILKACSFIDEWDNFLGIRTELEAKYKIQLIKRVVKPARKAIEKWTGLKSFRNEIIAHNFRDTKGNFRLMLINEYNCPKTTEELSYLIKFLHRMTSVLSCNFPMETNRILEGLDDTMLKKMEIKENLVTNSFNNLEESLKIIDNYISEEIFTIPRYDLGNASNHAQMTKKKDKK